MTNDQLGKYWDIQTSYRAHSMRQTLISVIAPVLRQEAIIEIDTPATPGSRWRTDTWWTFYGSSLEAFCHTEGSLHDGDQYPTAPLTISFTSFIANKLAKRGLLVVQRMHFVSKVKPKIPGYQSNAPSTMSTCIEGLPSRQLELCTLVGINNLKQY